MTGTALQTADAVDTWREVIALLAEAADRGYEEAITNPAAHSTALAADGLASAAIALLPEDLDHELDEVALDAVVTHGASIGEERWELINGRRVLVDIEQRHLDSAGLIRRAEQVTRRHPIEQLPAGASEVIVELLDLVREISP